MLRAFLLTQLFELSGMAVLAPKDKTALHLAFWVNTLTNLPFNLSLRYLNIRGYRPTYFGLLPAELLIVLIEGAIYKYALRWSWRRALTISLALNAFSYLGGYLLYRFIF